MQSKVTNNEGVLLQSRGSVFGDAVYFCCRGIRHYVRSVTRIYELGFKWPDDVIQVSESILKAFLPGGIIPGQWSNGFHTKNITSSLDMREIIGSTLNGIGLEIGAGDSPFPVSLNSNVRYADSQSYESLKAAIYPGQQAHDIIRPDYVTDIKTLAEISNSSFEFIIACHVIEHTNNPILALESCYRALKPGGSLVLIVPDMTKTFDSKRELTPLEHLIADFDLPSHERDRKHYEEFYTKAFDIPTDVTLNDYAAQKQAEGGDIHYHTWTFETFEKLVYWHIKKAGWTVSFSHPTLPEPENIEFYFVLTK